VGRRTLGAEELSRDVQGLAAHNDNLLSVEELLGDGAGEATEQVPLAVNDLISQVSQRFHTKFAVSGLSNAARAATAAGDRKSFRVSGGTYDDRFEGGHGVDSGCCAGG
jgi:hypothetical protein